MATFAIEKEPTAVLDYTFDWDGSDWLGSDTISSYTVTVDSGLTKDSASNTTTTVTVWLSGGTVGTNYDIVCHIVTAAGREDTRTLQIKVVDR